MFKAHKIQRIKGSLYGGAGNWDQLLRMFEWFKHPDAKPEWRFQPAGAGVGGAGSLVVPGEYLEAVVVRR